MHKCKICENQLVRVLDLGMQPSANNLLQKNEVGIKEEFFFPLTLAFCLSCKNAQIEDIPPKEMLFKEEYAYFSSTSNTMKKHFSDIAHQLISSHQLDKNSLVVEMGSNDGIFLKHFADLKIPHVGIEPSENVAIESHKLGVEAWVKFFDLESVELIKEKYTKADIIFAANVFSHIENILSVVEGVAHLLKEKGSFVFEVIYLPQILKRNTFDLIYDEHIFYFSLIGLQNMFDSFGLEIYDAQEISVHGGSIRCYTGLKSQHRLTDRYKKILADEEESGMDTIAPLQDFSKRVEGIKLSFNTILKDLKNAGKTIVGYGATAKSTTVQNYVEIDSSMLDYIVDNTPFKQNKFTPGKHIEITNEDRFHNSPPDYAVLFAWNYAQEIMAKEKAFTDNGGKWILFEPEVKIIP